MYAHLIPVWNEEKVSLFLKIAIMSCKSVFCVQEAKSCLCMCAVNNCFKHLKFFFSVDDKHSDREPKRPRPGRIFVDAFHRYCRGGWQQPGDAASRCHYCSNSSRWMALACRRTVSAISSFVVSGWRDCRCGISWLRRPTTFCSWLPNATSPSSILSGTITM